MAILTFSILEYKWLASKKCPPPCLTMNVVFGFPIYSPSDISKDASAFAKLYFKSQVQFQKSVLSYSKTSLLAEVGGYIGLLLGFSLLDIAKLLKKKPKLNKSRKSQKSTKKHRQSCLDKGVPSAEKNLI